MLKYEHFVSRFAYLSLTGATVAPLWSAAASFAKTICKFKLKMFATLSFFPCSSPQPLCQDEFHFQVIPAVCLPLSLWWMFLTSPQSQHLLCLTLKTLGYLVNTGFLVVCFLLFAHAHSNGVHSWNCTILFFCLFFFLIFDIWQRPTFRRGSVIAV